MQNHVIDFDQSCARILDSEKICTSIKVRAGFHTKKVRDKTLTTFYNLFNMQSELTALRGAIDDFTNLKQEFEQIRI